MSQGPETTQTIPGTVFDEIAEDLARTYAEAFINAIGDGEQAEEALGELEAIVADVIRANPRFAELLIASDLSRAEKDRILTETFEARALPTVVRFLRVLNRHDRLGLLPTIARQARALWDRRRNRRAVIVRSAVGLDDGQREALRGRLGRLINAEPIVTWEVDPALLGGLVVQVGDALYDASVRSRLVQIRRRILESRTRDVRALRGLIEL